MPAILDAGDSLLLTSGRVSIAAVLDLIGAGDGDNVLVPAFNCRAMIEPIVGMSVDANLYRLRPDLSVDLDDVEGRIDSQTRALLIVHYFGFHQDMQAIRSFCDRHSLLLVEDCAQCFFGQVDGRPPGGWGDYAIASLMKFFPVYDGGCVVSTRQRVGERRLRNGGLKFELKVTASILERSVEYRRLRPLNWLLWPVLRVKDLVWSFVKSRTQSSEPMDLGPNASVGGFAFEPRWLDVGMSRSSRAIVRVASKRAIVGRRRAIYRKFLEQLTDLPGCRPLFPGLPDSVVPYVFPLVVDAPGRVFPELKMRGVPIFRWEDIEMDVCATSADYAYSLLQFPCHHELRDTEVDWMLETIKGALTI